VTLRPDVTVLGRSPRSHVPVDDGRVSAEHARIERQGQAYVLRDLGSRNGTYVNGRRVSGAVVLHPGDQVRVGQTNFAFIVPAAPLPTPDTHLLAALAHGTALFTIASTVVPMVPVLVPLAIWLLARNRAPYVAFHALQAVLYQVCVVVVLLVVPADIRLPVWLAATGYAWFGALRCAQGRAFSYPFVRSVIGNRR
jgi:uncharacterized membrane protein